MSAPPHPGDLDLRIGTSDRGCTVTVTVIGDVDATGAPVLDGCLEELLARPAVGAVELDLSGVTFLDSAGLTVLARAHRSAERAGQVLRMRCGTRRAVLRPLEITGLAGTFTIVDTQP
jgi:anti-sigma B factor antagonist